MTRFWQRCIAETQRSHYEKLYYEFSGRDIEQIFKNYGTKPLKQLVLEPTRTKAARVVGDGGSKDLQMQKVESIVQEVFG